MSQHSNVCLSCFKRTNNNGICSSCGYNEKSNRLQGALPVRTLLNNRYLIGDVKLTNDAVIKYLAFDTKSEVKVCVTEYFPKKYCGRKGVQVLPLAGKEKFYNPAMFAKAVAGLKDFNDLPALVPILNMFAQNGTYYVVTAEFEGVSLAERITLNAPYKWSEFRKLFYPVLVSVSSLNSKGVYHLGISPDNILVCDDGKFRLDDLYLNCFRAENNSGTPFLSNDGFTAYEQYMSESVGSYSDVYSLCALMFYAMSGIKPEKSVERISNSTLSISSKSAQNMTKPVIEILSSGLAVLSKNRIKSVDILSKKMSPEATLTHSDASDSEENKTEKTVNFKNLLVYAVVVFSIIIALFVIAIAVILGTDGDSEDKPSSIVSISSVEQVSSTPSYVVNGHAVADYIGKQYNSVYKTSGNYIYFKTEISVKHRDDVAKGIVIEQEPSAGTMLAEGSVIELTISLGPENVEIGDYKGWTLSNTVIELLGKGYSKDNIKYEYKTDIYVDSGKVVGTSINPYSKGNIYEEITVYINDFKYSALTPSGTMQVPSVPNTSSATGSVVSTTQSTVTSVGG